MKLLNVLPSSHHSSDDIPTTSLKVRTSNVRGHYHLLLPPQVHHHAYHVHSSQISLLQPQGQIHVEFAR